MAVDILKLLLKTTWFGHKTKLVGHVPQCAPPWLRHWVFLITFESHYIVNTVNCSMHIYRLHIGMYRIPCIAHDYSLEWVIFMVQLLGLMLC